MHDYILHDLTLSCFVRILSYKQIKTKHVFPALTFFYFHHIVLLVWFSYIGLYKKKQNLCVRLHIFALCMSYRLQCDNSDLAGVKRQETQPGNNFWSQAPGVWTADQHHETMLGQRSLEEARVFRYIIYKTENKNEEMGE